MTLLFCNTYQRQQTASFQIVAGSNFDVFLETSSSVVNLDGYNVRTGNGNQNGGSITPDFSFYGRSVETMVMDDSPGASEYLVLRLSGGAANVDLFSYLKISGDFSAGFTTLKYFTDLTIGFHSEGAVWTFGTYNVGVFVPGNTYTIELGVD